MTKLLNIYRNYGENNFGKISFFFIIVYNKKDYFREYSVILLQIN